MAPTRSQALLLGFARKSSMIIIGIAVIVLLGWGLRLPMLTSLSPRWAAMNPFSALLFIAAGIALRRLLQDRRRDHPDRLARLLSAIVAMGGIYHLVQTSFGFEFPGARFITMKLMGAGYEIPKLAPTSAFCLLFCGAGLFLMDLETRRGIRPAQLCFLLGAFIGWLALLGYVYRVLPLYTIGSTVPMALISAIEFVLLSLGGLCARPDQGVMHVITSDTTAGASARRLLPAAVMIPFVLGAIRLMGDRRGVWESEFGDSLFAVANMLIFAVLIWWNSRLLFRAEQQRRRAERRLSIQYGATLVLAEARQLNQAVHRILRSICTELGWSAGVLWRVDDRASLIRCEDVVTTSTDVAEFADATRKLSFAKGTALPGQIWHRREPVWIENVNDAPEYTRSLATTQAGLHSVIAVPIGYDGVTCGVLEFFSTRCERRDQPLLETLAAVGSQIGQFAERKAADDQLKQASAELERSNAELEHFAYVASHDLSEPLRMIVSYLQLLLSRHRASLNAEAQEFIGYAIDGAERMQKLIHDLLAYARVGSRGHELHPVDSGQALDAAIQNLKVVIEETGAAVERDTLPVVRGDSIQLTQVFQNLISNAIKFRSREAPRIRISAQLENGNWAFAVQDNGIGIEPKNFERLFVLFQRLHTRREYPGTGIGLALCKKIIERHGGRIWLESTPGEGTTFHFTLRPV